MIMTKASKPHAKRYVCLQVIQLEFLNLHTEACCDKIDVFDVESSSAGPVGTFSGFTVPGDIFSDSALRIHFYTDISETYNGFNISYTITDYNPGTE